MAEVVLVPKNISTDIINQRVVEKIFVLNLCSLVWGWGREDFYKAFNKLPMFVRVDHVESWDESDA